jgi:hypothetical protein
MLLLYLTRNKRWPFGPRGKHGKDSWQHQRRDGG